MLQEKKGKEIIIHKDVNYVFKIFQNSPQQALKKWRSKLI